MPAALLDGKLQQQVDTSQVVEVAEQQLLLELQVQVVAEKVQVLQLLIMVKQQLQILAAVVVDQVMEAHHELADLVVPD